MEKDANNENGKSIIYSEKLKDNENVKITIFHHKCGKNLIESKDGSKKEENNSVCQK